MAEGEARLYAPADPPRARMREKRRLFGNNATLSFRRSVRSEIYETTGHARGRERTIERSGLSAGFPDGDRNGARRRAHFCGAVKGAGRSGTRSRKSDVREVRERAPFASGGGAGYSCSAERKREEERAEYTRRRGRTSERERRGLDRCAEVERVIARIDCAKVARESGGPPRVTRAIERNSRRGSLTSRGVDERGSTSGERFSGATR